MIIIKNNNDKELKQIIDKGLSDFNREHCKWFKDKALSNEDEYLEREYNFIAYDEGRVIGGAIGFIQYNWYFLDLLYVDSEYRGQDIGTKLIKEIENLAKNEKLTGIRMETWDFQAKEFYKKMGYEVYATIEDCPPGTVDNFLRKRI